MIAGEAGAGGGDQGRQRAAARPARRPDLRVAALPEPRGGPGRVGSGDRVQLSGPAGRAAAELSDELWRLDPDSLSLAGAATAVAMPLAHTVELNAGTLDTDAGPRLQANWTWARSALDHAQVGRLSRLWFEALAGICAHVRAGGGGLTPVGYRPGSAEPAADRRAVPAIRDRRRVAVDPAAAGTAVSRRHRAGSGDDVYAVQLDITVTGPLDAHRLREAVHTVVSRHPQPGGPLLRPVRRAGADHPGRSGGAWQYVELEAGGGDVDVDVEEQVQQVCAGRTCRGLRPGRPAGVSGGVDPHRSRSAPVCAHQSPHRDGWLVEADPAAGNLCQLLRAAAARGRCRIAAL